MWGLVVPEGVSEDECWDYTFEGMSLPVNRAILCPALRKEQLSSEGSCQSPKSGSKLKVKKKSRTWTFLLYCHLSTPPHPTHHKLFAYSKYSQIGRPIHFYGCSPGDQKTYLNFIYWVPETYTQATPGIQVEVYLLVTVFNTCDLCCRLNGKPI